MTATVFGELTADGETIVLVAQGADYEIAAMAKVLPELTPLMERSQKSLGVPGGMTCALSWAAVVQLSHTYGDSWQPGPALSAWIAEQIRRRTHQPAQLYVTPPARRIPRSYQVTAAAMIREVGSFLLFDEAGTGKTASTVLGLVERAAQRHPVLPIVIVAPASVVDIWVEHFRDWAPFWRVVAWRGTPARRRRLMHTGDVYVTSYGTCTRDAPGTLDEDGRRIKSRPLLELHPAAVVADEVHMLKHQATAQSQAVRRLAAGAQIFGGLSGTPITHNPGDIWATLNAMDPAAYPSRDRWITRYCQSIRKDYSVEAIGFGHREPEFRITLLGANRRVAKADVATELPPKIYTVRTVDIPPKWRAVYDQMEADMLAELPDGGQMDVMDVLSQLGVLRALAAAPCDMEISKEWVLDKATGEWVEKTHRHTILQAPSWKVNELLDVMTERPGQPIVAFAPSKQLIDLAGAAATAAGYRVGYIVGGQSAGERTANREAFQRGELDLIGVTTAAGGIGITLTRSACAVFLQRPWSLVEAMQSEDRLHRIGAEVHEHIEIIDVVARNTVESRVRTVLKTRAGQLADFVRDPRIVAEILGGASVTQLRRKAS